MSKLLYEPLKALLCQSYCLNRSLLCSAMSKLMYYENRAMVLIDRASWGNVVPQLLIAPQANDEL